MQGLPLNDSAGQPPSLVAAASGGKLDQAHPLLNSSEAFHLTENNPDSSPACEALHEDVNP